MTDQRTAILFFTRSLEDEFKAKSFGLKVNRFRLLYSTLLKKTRQTLQATGLPVFEIDSRQQVGTSFGDRLVNAIRQVQQQGFEHILIVGNDTPAMSVELLKKAASDLSDGNSVLGQDFHGGSYLIGLIASKTDFEGLRALDWHSAGVFESLKSLLNANTDLPLLADLNTREDLLQNHRRDAVSHSLLIFLKSLVFGSLPSVTTFLVSLIPCLRIEPSLRGPPLMAY